MQNVDLTLELTQLLDFAAGVGVAIRMYSSYAKSYPRKVSEQEGIDLMFLADSIHNLPMLTTAIVQKNPSQIIFACDALAGAFNQYLTDIPKYGIRQAFKTFNSEANKAHVDLSSVIKTLEAIKHKVQVN